MFNLARQFLVPVRILLASLAGFLGLALILTLGWGYLNADNRDRSQGVVRDVRIAPLDEIVPGSRYLTHVTARVTAGSKPIQVGAEYWWQASRNKMDVTERCTPSVIPAHTSAAVRCPVTGTFPRGWVKGTHARMDGQVFIKDSGFETLEAAMSAQFALTAPVDTAPRTRPIKFDSGLVRNPATYIADLGEGIYVAQYVDERVGEAGPVVRGVAISWLADATGRVHYTVWDPNGFASGRDAQYRLNAEYADSLDEAWEKAVALAAHVAQPENPAGIAYDERIPALAYGDPRDLLTRRMHRR